MVATVVVVGAAGRKWGRWLYVRYGRFILPRSIIAPKSRPATPPLLLDEGINDGGNVEGRLDESGEMLETVSLFRV